MSVEHYGRVPYLPEGTLRKHKVYEPADTRFRAAARLRQALFREENAWPIGSYRTKKGRTRKLGSYINASAAQDGANFISPAIAKLVRREVAFREDGALYDETRLQSNLLSSHPATFNILGPMKLDIELATATFQALCPDFVREVTGVLFEHSPARGHRAFTHCRTAYDALFKCRTTAQQNGFVAVELKFSETMNESPATMRPRYDELSQASGLYKNPDHPALRSNPLQQFWRQHMLAQAMVQNGLYTVGRFMVIAPRFNAPVQEAIRLYREHLADNADAVTFDAVTFETVIAMIRNAGATEIAQQLYARYCDFDPVDALI